MDTSDRILRAALRLAGVLGRGLEQGIVPLGPLVPGRVFLPRRAWVPLTDPADGGRLDAGPPVAPGGVRGRRPDARPAQA